MQKRSRNWTPRVVLGLLFVAFGTLATLGNLGYEVGDVLEFWPLALVLIGLAKLSGSLWTGLFWILAGGVFLVPRFVDRVDAGDLWPLFLILIGLRVATRSFTGRRRRRGAAPVTAAGDTIRLTAVFATRRRRVTSRAFRGGEVVAILGGGEVDLTEARPAGRAVLNVLALWGGVDVRVPLDWRVSMEVTAVMGGVEDTRDAAERAAAEPVTEARGDERAHGDERPHLVVKGFTMMGGVDVRS